MRRVGTKELKNRLSHYLRLVKSGSRLLITDRGRPIAEIGPAATADGDTERAWTLAASRGQVSLPVRNSFRPARPVKLRNGATLSDAVNEDRS